MWRTGSRGIRKWGEELTVQIKLEIENYWKEYVVKGAAAKKTPVKNKYYVLSMFPYPSGKLHMGHVRVYSISDSISQFKRMSGMQVIHPMGWDAFGLPAENAAIDHNTSPKLWTHDNVAKMKQQLLQLGCHFDWDREINTSQPDYYKWTQALFLKLYDAGLVYKKEAFVNWDPVDQTVLADEQVDANGCSWRSGAKIEKKLLNQWFVRTTKFAQQLYEGLNDSTLENWRDIIQLQKHWIGECNGITIDFELMYTKSSLCYIKNLTGWTEKPESLLCAKYLLVPVDSKLNSEELVLYEKDTFKKLCIVALNPLTNEELPVFVAKDFAFAEGSDAHIGAPAINEIDRSFATAANISFSDKGSFVELDKVRNDVCNLAREKNVGGHYVSSKLRDWLISRQRYWGTPIPIVFCESCGTKPVPIEELPVILPDVEVLSRNCGSPLKNIKEWTHTRCPNCGGRAVRETDTMDTFVDSSWYYFRYLDPKNKSDLFSDSIAKENMPVDVYVGGKEHAVLHLYYARFISHFLHSIGKSPEREPFKRLLVQGMVMGKSFKLKDTGKYITSADVTITDDKGEMAVTTKDNLPVEIAWEKMSKSKYNGVDPSVVMNEYGCDTTRLLMLADVSPTSNRHWSLDTLPGVLNWQNRLWLTVNEFIKLRSNPGEVDVTSKEFKSSEEKLWDSRNYFTSNATFNYDITHQLSIAISRLQGLTNSLRKCPSNFIPISSEFELALAAQIIMVAPIIPHFASELWSGFTSAENRINNSNPLINWDSDVLEQNWPVVDSHYELGLSCFVDGHDCVLLKINSEKLNRLTSETALDLALTNEKVQRKTKRGVGNVNFCLYPNCRASIKISTVKKQKIPEILVDVL